MASNGSESHHIGRDLVSEDRRARSDKSRHSTLLNIPDPTHAGNLLGPNLP
jgi:hypothetical protein